ncbi:MAG: hypothetical protein ACFCVE_02065 [Phycisphaerae bacterium]
MGSTQRISRQSFFPPADAGPGAFAGAAADAGAVPPPWDLAGLHEVAGPALVPGCTFLGGWAVAWVLNGATLPVQPADLSFCGLLPAPELAASPAAHALPAGGCVAWVGPGVWPYPPTLARNGLLARSLFVNARDWRRRAAAAETAARSGACAAVVLDGRGLSFTATRRLQLAARSHPCRLLALYPSDGAHAPSAAGVRWRVEPVQPPKPPAHTNAAANSAAAVLTCHPTHPAWKLTLLRCKGMWPAALKGITLGDELTWILRWDPRAGLPRLEPNCLEPDHTGPGLAPTGLAPPSLAPPDLPLRLPPQLAHRPPAPSPGWAVRSTHADHTHPAGPG